MYLKKNTLLLIFIAFIIFFILISINFIYATSCWTYTTSSQCSADTSCKWKNDSWSTSGWCEELNCWSLYSQSECTSNIVPGKNCTWQGGTTNYWCEKISCWSLSGTNITSCENNTKGLNCQWSDYCYSDTYTYGVNCYTNTTRGTCTNLTGCKWGQCMEKGCWSYNLSGTCVAGKDPWSGKNCTWDSGSYCTNAGCWRYYQNQSVCGNASGLGLGLNCQWKWDSCQDIDCWSYDFTNETACVNNTYNLSCSWNQGSYCNKKDCWNYMSQSACSNRTECNWKAYTSSGWCNEVNCWSWDYWSGGTESACLQNSSIFNLNCVWQNSSAGGGWCYKNYTTSVTTCANKTTERDCLDTYYCWWQYNDFNNAAVGGSCKEPGSMNYTTNATTIFNDWNPGCYIFDMNTSDCANVTGCTYANSRCSSADDDFGRNITAFGLNCTYINNSQLCNALPVLSSCCVWQGGLCVSNKLSTACRDQLQQKTENSCEDAKTQTRCDQIAGEPWYMPCRWQNSTDKCEFKASDVFGGNVSYSLMLIDNKMSCQAAGGKWITENYCEGNISVPLGRCEYKFDEEDNCDKACFACEIKDSSGSTVNSSNAASACAGSKLGFCEFHNDTGASNSVGYCKAKIQFKKGIAGDCNSVCGDCTFKGSAVSNDTAKRPSYHCVTSKANSDGGGCKWVTDNSTITGGYCMNKGEKTCEDACDRCKTQTACSNTGRTALTNQSGSCKWQTGTSSCVANIEGDVEVCWDGVDNNNNSLVDCADAACFADSFCGIVSGDCFGWTTNTSCILHNASCEWVIDKWGSWCDFKGSQCWRYNQNISICDGQTNCKWNNGTGGSSWCEKDWDIGQICMGLGQGACWGVTNCEWTNDTWCNGTGGGTDWCRNYGGWCDHTDFKPKNCWLYNSGSIGCNNHTGCNWKTDSWSQPHCEVNWSANCWSYMSNDSVSCSSNPNCYWDVPSQGSGWCMNKADKCWSYSTSATCGSALGGSRCYWHTWGDGTYGSCQSMCWNSSFNTASTCDSSYGCVWKAENGWCEESASCWNFDGTGCLNATGIAAKCRWKSPGWCDPKGGGFSSTAATTGGGVGTAVGADCYKYDNNRTQCTNKTIINISCGWTINNNPTCDVNWGVDCWKYSQNQTACNVTNGCWFNNQTSGSGWCSNIMDQCWSNNTYSSWSNADGWNGNCTANYLCTNNSWGGCEPKCSSLNSSSCVNATYTGKCKWNAGWCNPKGMNDMFNDMGAGMPALLGWDDCNEAVISQKSVDICGFGMRDTGDSYGFGTNVADFSNSSVCNKEKLSSFVMGMVGTAAGGQFGGGSVGMSVVQTGMTNFGTERTGAGNDTVIYFVYLDTDGSTSGGCTRSNADNSTGAGYEFKFRYASEWSASLDKAVETYNSYECKDSDWKGSDIKISAWKKMMCSDIGGPMIAIKKADLTKFPALYDSTKDIRVYVMTLGNTGNVSVPSDNAGPGWATPGSIDFEIANAFAYGADTAKFEDILKKGFVQGEDCFNTIDDDNDGNADCNDWDCQYSSKCSGLGVNAAGYSDTSTPLVTGVKIEEYFDSALIMYDTNKPTNGTLELYGYGDIQCLNKTDVIYDVGILKNNSVRMYKMWHTAMIYETNESVRGLNTSIRWPLVAGSTYNYKIKVCDSNNKCSISRCSNFTLPVSMQKCAYCNFVTRIKVPTGWNVSYDSDMDGTYDHLQGYVCGANAGMKTNYTIGRKVNIKLAKSDGSTYIEFLNATLTKSGLNDKVRTISTSGDMIHNTASGFVGLTSETRDKIINNLHPEVCKIKIPVLSGGTCDILYHCDDSGANCVDRTAAAGGAPTDAANCVWTVPFCEFSTYKTTAPTGGATAASGGGGGGGTAASVIISLGELTGSKVKEIAVSSQIKFNISSVEHKLILTALTNTTATITIQSILQTFIFSVGDLKNIDVNEDNAAEISVKLDSINSVSKKATFNITKLSGAAVVPSVSEEEKAAEEAAGEGEEVVEEGKIGTTSWIVIAIVAALVVVIVYFLASKKRR